MRVGRGTFDTLPTMQMSSPARRRAAMITAAALALLLLRHLLAIFVSLDRTLHVDELEYLHVGWLLAHGRHLYRDFVEDHAPFLFVILKWLVPGGTPSMPRVDMIAYGARGRIVTAACGVVALGAMGTLAYRAVRSTVAPLLAVTFLLCSPWLWSRGLADIRNDPPALCLFWAGALLLIGQWRSERRRLVLAGVGIGLAAAAALWNPKTVCESVVLGVIYLSLVIRALRRSMRDAALAVVPAIVIVAITIALIAATASLNDYFFFTFRFNQIVGDWLRDNPSEAREFFHNGLVLRYCDPIFAGWWPVLAACAAMTVLLVPAIRRRLRLDIRIYGSLVALGVAALIDIRFIFPWPNVWQQYYLVWGFVLAAVYAVTIAALFEAVLNEKVRAVLQVAVAALAVVMTDQVLPRAAEKPTYSPTSWLQSQLRPGETVWLSAELHPVDAPDASYYWFAFDLVAASLRYTASHPGQSPLPNIREDDLPPCRAERGLMPELRFVGNSWGMVPLPIARACLDRMVKAGRATRSRVHGVWDFRAAAASHR